MQMHAVGSRPIDETLYRLLRLASLVQSPLSPDLPQHPDLSLNEWRLIVIMSDKPGQSVQDLSRATGMDKMNVSRAVRRLMTQNILSRTRDDLDRRRICHNLTPEGWQLFQQSLPDACRSVNQLMQDVTADERAILMRVFSKLETRMELQSKPAKDTNA